MALALAAMRGALEDFRGLVVRLDRQVDPVAASLNLTLDDTRLTMNRASVALGNISATMQQADVTLKSADGLLRDEQILSALDEALEEISAAAQATGCPE